MAIYLSGVVSAPFPQSAGDLALSTSLSGVVSAPFPQANARLSFYLSGAVIANMPVASGVLAGSIPRLSGSVTAQIPEVAGYLSIVSRSANGLALALNLKNKTPSMYEGFAYDSLSKLGNVHLAVGVNGIVELGAGQDEGVEISGSIIFGETDFSAPEHKRISDLYLNLRTNGALAVTTIADEVNTTTYQVTAPSSEKIETVRVKHGRGTKGRYWQSEIRNVDGADFELQGITMLVDVLSRRI